MDEIRTKKLEAGREKLAAYKRKKQKQGKRSPGDVTPSQSSDSCSSLGVITPDNTNREDQEQSSIASTISEHLDLGEESVERDRSCREIEISNFLENLPCENKQFRDVGDATNVEFSIKTHVRDILNEIVQQFKSQSDDNSFDTDELSLNIFEGISLDDSSINKYIVKKQLRYDSESDSLNHTIPINIDECGDVNVKKIKNLKEKLVKKDDIIATLTAELESFKEQTSNQSTLSLNTSTTEYKQFHEEYHNKIVEFQNVLAFKDSLINKLEESIQQLLLNREELQRQSENFAREISQLQTQLMETSNIIKQHICTTFAVPQCTVDEKSNSEVLYKDQSVNFETECTKLKETLNSSQVVLLNELNVQIHAITEQKMNDLKSMQESTVKILKDKLESEKIEHELEVCRLRELLASVKCGSTEILELRNELETKHAREMEELRTYFEKKCADLEKHYSEEIFSQQSRKLSGSSSCSEELVSDVCMKPSGPGGDSVPNPNLKDLMGIVKNLSKIDDFNALRDELLKYDFFKLPVNKFVHEDYEKKIKSLNANHENELRSVRDSYQEQVNALKYELKEAMRTVQMNVSSAVQEVMLAASADDSEWPRELLQIRNRFVEKYETQIVEMRAKHDKEMSRLKEEHVKILNGALERARRRSLRDNEVSNQSELEIIKDRDALKKTNSTLRNLLGELLKYFTQCEDELNNTLVGEIIKHGFDKNLTQIEDELETSLNTNCKRVHFTPNFGDFLNIIGNSESESPDLSIDFKNELGSCLERLRTDANALLAMTTNVRGVTKIPDDANTLEERITSLTRQVITDSQVKNDLVEQLDEARIYAQNVESERVSLENQVEQLGAKQKILEGDLTKANKKIADLIECGRREVVSEGFGQNDRNLSDVATLADLQEKARILVADWKNGSDHPLIQLVEELCREGERLTEDARRDRDDLKQQVNLLDDFKSRSEKIDAADKKLRTTCNFLEEQAMEREQERDESQREIATLREQLKEREKDKTAYELISKEVEQLEQQMREMTKMIEISEQKQQEVENERKEAVDKIWVLRDIIRDLESQVESKTESEIELKSVIGELQEVIRQLNKTNEELARQLESYNCPDFDQLRERVVYLEGEAQRLRINSELIGSEGALKEIQTQLDAIETSIDKRTRDLEGLHSRISTTSCSSPSEDMSIRDQIRPHTPNSTIDECDIPLQQLARLKEKLVKHSRAEEAAVKRIRDLEMQLLSSKQDLEETQNEKEILQNQVTEQIVLLSSLQMRLDEQRLRAEHVQKQANTSLEVRIYDLESETQSLKETVHNRDKTIRQLNKAVEETKQRLEDRERELHAKTEDKAISALRQEIEKLNEENRLLKVKIDSDAQNAQLLPGLVDNIIADKNSDIEKLRETLSDTQKQLDTYLSLNLDHEQLKQLSQLRSSDRALSDILSLVDFDASDQVRKVESQVESLDSPVNLHYKRNPNETALMGGLDISRIEKLGPIFNLSVPLSKPNSTEIHKSTDKRVHFKDTDMELTDLKDQVVQKDKLIVELSDRLKILNDLERNVDCLQKNLQSTEDALNEATVTFEKQQKLAEDSEKNLRVEIAENKMHLMEKEKSLELSKQDTERKDKMYMALAKEKRALEKKVSELEGNLSHYGGFDALMIEKNQEIYRLEEQLSKLLESCVNIEDLELKLKTKQAELTDTRGKLVDLEEQLEMKTKEFANQSQQLKETQDVNEKLIKDLTNKSNQLNSLGCEINELKCTIKTKDEELKKLQNLLVDRECELEILNEDITRYQNEAAKPDQDLELQLMKNRKQLAEKDLELVKLKTAQEDLNKEVRHLQDYLTEKDRIIDQMKADIKSLHVNLETIQNKIQETGNIVDLRKRLLEEQHLNAVLQEENQNLKTADRKERSTSIEDIAGQVQKQLDYSAHLDSSILQALSSGDEYNENVVRTEQTNDELKQFAQQLERKLEFADAKINQLENLLEQQRHNSYSIQIEDAKLIEQMRIKLETFLDNENEFATALEREKALRQNIEAQLTALKAKANLSASSNSKTELTDYKSLPLLESQELKQLRGDVGTLKELNDKLKADNKMLKRSKSEQDSILKYTKDMLELKMKELSKLKESIEQMRQNEMAVREQLVECKSELNQRNREVENSRILMAELEHERVEMKKETILLSEKVRELNEEKRLADLAQQQRDVHMSSPVPDKFLNKMKELSGLLKDNMREHKVMSDTLARLTNERSALQDKVRVLEQRNDYKMPGDDPTARAKHIFARYLRSESYRKSLIWQKRYLVALLVTYQDYRPSGDHLLLSDFEPKHKKVVRSHGINKFRSAVLAVIAIHRVKYLVQRWRSGKRMGVNMGLHQYKNLIIGEANSNVNVHSAQFQLGQPVSSTNFSTAQRNPLFRSMSCDLHDLNPSEAARYETNVTPTKSAYVPWSGATPPQKEVLRGDDAAKQSAPDIPLSNENLSPLQTPHLLSHYVKRFNDIQQRLGMTIENLNS